MKKSLYLKLPGHVLLGRAAKITQDFGVFKQGDRVFIRRKYKGFTCQSVGDLNKVVKNVPCEVVDLI